jgi:hypothetical protein
MSLDNVANSFFGCAESPVWIPNDFDITKVPDCKSCNLRLTSPVPGSGTLNKRVDGLLVDENPLTTLSVNGIMYNLAETVLMIAGAHRLPGRSDPCAAELALYFKSTRDFSQIACLTLPIDIGTGGANKYFETLGTLKTGRPRVSSIVPADASYLLYRGADLRGRSANSKVPSEFCDPVKSIVTFYVCLTPIFMTNKDYQRFVARGGWNRVGPPSPLTPVVNSRLVELTTIVKGIQLGAAKPLAAGGGTSGGPLGGPGYPVKSMKCYRVDPNRDIVKDRVYVGGKGKPTSLEKELKAEEGEGLMPGDVQGFLSRFIGIALAIIIAAFAFVFIFNNIFVNYAEAQHLYEPNPVSAHTLTSKIFPEGMSFFPKGFSFPSLNPFAKACPEVPSGATK